MAGQMFSKNNFKNLFLLFFIICQFGAIVSDSHIWDWGVYLALNILIVLYVYLRPGETRTKSSQQKLLIAVLIHTAVIISTLWRAYRVSFIMDIFFDIFGLLGNFGIYSDPEIWLVKEIELLPGCKRTERSHKTSMANT